MSKHFFINVLYKDDDQDRVENYTYSSESEYREQLQHWQDFDNDGYAYYLSCSCDFAPLS